MAASILRSKDEQIGNTNMTDEEDSEEDGQSLETMESASADGQAGPAEHMGLGDPLSEIGAMGNDPHLPHVPEMMMENGFGQ